MSITESRIRKIIREEARRMLREGGRDDLPGPKFPPGSVKFPGLEKFGSFEPPEGWDDEEEGDEDEEMSVESVIDRYKDEGPRSWMRVSNDFHEMADGGMDDIREKYYPGLTAEDCAEIAAELDRHFGMD